MDLWFGLDQVSVASGVKNRIGLDWTIGNGTPTVSAARWGGTKSLFFDSGAAIETRSARVIDHWVNRIDAPFTRCTPMHLVNIAPHATITSPLWGITDAAANTPAQVKWSYTYSPTATVYSSSQNAVGGNVQIGPSASVLSFEAKDILVLETYDGSDTQIYFRDNLGTTTVIDAPLVDNDGDFDAVSYQLGGLQRTDTAWQYYIKGYIGANALWGQAVSAAVASDIMDQMEVIGYGV
jgi:hypothetical protein